MDNTDLVSEETVECLLKVKTLNRVEVNCKFLFSTKYCPYLIHIVIRHTQAVHNIQEEIQPNIMVELDDIESMLFRLQTILL